MPKLSLTAAPTFPAYVPVPVAGGPAVEVLMTFKHRTKTALEAFTSSRDGKTDTETFMDMVEGWELEEPFNQDSVEILLQNRVGTAFAAYRQYLDCLLNGGDGRTSGGRA